MIGSTKGSRRRIAVGALVMLAAVVAAVAGVASAATHIQHGTTLTVWSAQTENAAIKQAFVDYQKATGTKVNVVVVPDPYETNVLTKVAAGQRPDLLFWQPTRGELGVINAAKVLQPLDGEPYLKKEPKSISTYAGRIGGHTYAAIFGPPAIEGVFYNKQDFQKAGITSLPTNFGQFKATAAKLKASGITPLYDAGADKWPTQWLVDQLMAEAWSKGGLAAKLNANKATFSDPRFLGAVTTYKSLVDDGFYNADIKTGTFNAQAEAIFSGSAAMAFQGNWLINQLTATHPVAQVNANVGFFPISGRGNATSFVADQSVSLVAPKTGNSSRETAAKGFLRWLLGPYYGKYLKNSHDYPALVGYPVPKGVTTAIIAAQRANGKNGLPLMQMVLAVIPDIHIYLADMIQGGLTPQDVADKMTGQFRQLAKAEHLPGF